MGVFAIDRAIFDHHLFDGEKYSRRDAWIWLVGNAVWKPAKVRVGSRLISLGRGQLAYSERFLATAWGWSKSRVHRFLFQLKIEAMIEIKTDHETNHITICNYNNYQFLPIEHRTDFEPVSGPVLDQFWTKEEELNKEIREGAAKAAATALPLKRKKQLPEGWLPNDTGRTLAMNAGFQPEVLLENFTDYHRARGSVMLDWDAAFRTWIKNQIRFQKERAPNGRRTGNLAGIL